MSRQTSSVRTALTHAGRKVLPESTQANPRLRQVIADRREIAAMTRDRVSSPIAAFKFYALTTPGKLVVIMFALTLASLLTGWYSSATLNERSQTLESLIDRSEPLAESAEVLYSSLSVADAAANSAFISGGRESPDLRRLYADAIASSGTSLVASADGGAPASTTSGPGARISIRDDLDTMAVQIPTYTGVIETARTNNRLGNPVGSAYLVQASSLMQDEILPAAQRLYDERSAAISEPQRTLTVPPWGMYVALFGTIVMLLGCGRYLAYRTRRHFNIGLVLGAVALMVGTLWLLVTGLTSVAAANTAKNSGAEPLHELTTMRILTQQARSVETLGLIRRSDPGAGDRNFSAAIDQIRTKASALLAEHENEPGLRDPLQQVQTSIVQWERAHREVSRRLAAGDFNAARSLTIGTGTISTASGYEQVNASLLSAIDDTRSTFRNNIHTAQQLLGYTGTGIGWLCVVAAVAVVAGLVQRIREYR
ncbi:hypothetical protein GOHSU_32_00150 [Gordonia hirsuta DSM 44140 = NBRC 16056]|uniref:Chemotaxis methyl-accepting receptor HlyB-like 4HB MCP domain-containing protein n=1 Tax=Gordonia hirsuta DSM 44140 = NBRC 16056 TaxID=1121927 RepID=L7LDS5_9ACTN|nr:hypothetical protein [Gordonia hirsuta]GAC58198.1 hypothetical protein GOHSU_32_00150 [Gordonia hirsuta DSM 44140 = NBRC 16056]